MSKKQLKSDFAYTAGEPSPRLVKRQRRKAAIARGVLMIPRQRPSKLIDHNSGRMTRDGRKGEARK